MERYIFIKDDVEGKGVTESLLLHPQLLWVTWSECALETGAWRTKQTQLFHT